jgi:hypothetical protein
LSAGRPPTEHEKRVVAVRHEDCKAMLDLAHAARTRHVTGVKLSDDTIEQAPEVIAALDDPEVHVHYTMIPPEGAPAYDAWQRTGAPLLLQVRTCIECGERVLFA